MESAQPNRPSRCTWKPNATNSPHTLRTEVADRNKVMPDILTTIGQTPLVKLNTIPKSHGIKCEMYAKCEFFNPGGSVKDRIAYRMIQDAEDQGLLKPGYTIIEPTSGNTGIGLAMAAAVKGYRCIIVMPEKMSNEKVYTLHALGAEIIRTPTEASWNSPEAHINVAHKLQKEIPNSIVLDQYTNPGNPLAHYDQTALEIWNQCDGKIDYLVAGAGTGGTISGIGRKLKELSPDTKIVAVDPKGSILAQSPELQDDADFYEVEGIGYDFIPTVLDHNVIDRWIKTEDCESLNAARMLIRQEGLLCGGSSGAALVAALQVAKDLPEGKRVVLVLPDGIRNYMTKFVSDHWMEVRGFLESKCQVEANKWWWDMPISNLSFDKVPLLESTKTCQEAVHIFEKTKSQQLVVSNDNKHVQGVIILDTLMSNLLSGSVKLTDLVEKAMIKHYVKVKLSASLGQLSRVLEKELYSVIVSNEGDHTFVGIVNQSHILKHITKSNGTMESNN
ncbi:cystathionine beta-synthase [Hylaeus anthracinus]|uniref:cystathionine beta-synthase n=1 Tax=Hylaeus anthracinus TaxID=313031 RepID=UPI0023B93521|nr:cystathionine beta-synthase [Hylaeus anthracinus]XP_054001543.1 cystathionine beta-synthase [Hylaeus anthracinus]XP_054001544.1 cystathionine beta-synthase [Hylaeus anthracinus]